MGGCQNVMCEYNFRPIFAVVVLPWLSFTNNSEFSILPSGKLVQLQFYKLPKDLLKAFY